MSSVKIHKKRRKTRKSTSGIWRPYGVQKTPRHTQEERLAIRKRRIRIISLTIGAVLGLIGTVALAVASHTPRFQIRDLAVKGNQVLSERVIQAVAETTLYDGRLSPLSRHSILFFSRQAMERMLEMQFPRLKDTQVAAASYKNGIVHVSVVERVPYALWCHESDCFLLDEHGFIFAPRKGDDLVRDEIFYGGLIHADPIGVWFLPSYFEEVMRTIEAVERVNVNVVSLEVVNEHEYRMKLAEGTHLLVRFNEDPNIVANNLKTALSSEALLNKLHEVEYIDLRYDNRVYYK